MLETKTKEYLEARAAIASDLFIEGKITRREMFRLEMDAALQEDTGDIVYEENKDFQNKEM